MVPFIDDIDLYQRNFLWKNFKIKCSDVFFRFIMFDIGNWFSLFNKNKAKVPFFAFNLRTHRHNILLLPSFFRL